MTWETSVVSGKCIHKSNYQFQIPRQARHPDDTEGVAEISPGLPESARATPGLQSLQPIAFARSAASEASISRTPLDHADSWVI
jgi:hypothetical protein